MSVRTVDAAVAVDRARKSRTALVTSHLSPDGDALGSELGLSELLTTLGVRHTVVNHDPAPANLSKLPGLDRVVVAATLPAELLKECDLLITVECPGIDRPGFADLDRLPILNVDHHKDSRPYGEVNYLDPQAPAVGELVWRMFEAAGVKPSADAATNMYVALSTDTGDFRYPNTTSRAFVAAAALAEAGARPSEVAEWVHECRSASSIRLLGEALRTLQLECDGRFALISVDADAFRRAGASPKDTEDLIAAPRSIAGVQAVAFLKQWEPGEVRVSFRSKGSVDVQKVAARFGGGGHTNASGCTISGELETVRQLVTAAFMELLGGRR